MYVYMAINKVNDNFSINRIFLNKEEAQKTADYWNDNLQCKNYVVRKYELVEVND